jgi:adenosylcobyric acid synthase
MVLGTTSGAGKSWLATALCRHYARQGLRVAPFKAQNMSNNARVVGEGEIGSAQFFQALAARAEPDVRMNPLLLKPESDTHSQVVLMGQVRGDLGAMPWRERSSHVWPAITAALDALRAEYDVVVIEGAGSPAEINLADCDVVNLRVARHCNAACLLVTDIDRGGAFAHLYGTWALLPEADRPRIKGFVLNKFRGDPALLAPGPQMLQDLTGVPTVAVLPMWWQHGLPEEDGVIHARPEVQGVVARTIAVVATPRISNLDEFQPLNQLPGVSEMGAWPGRPDGRRLGHPARLQTHQQRPGLAARPRPGPRHCGTCRAGRGGAGHLRRPADAGRGADRPAWHRWQRARSGPAAAGHGV